MHDQLPMAMPLLQGADRCFYPEKPFCPLCGNTFANGAAYIMCGALAVDPVTRDEVEIPAELESHLNIGFHSSDTEVRGCADITIVKDLHWGQFDLHFCSLACLRRWFNQVIDALEQEAASTMP